MGLFRRKSPEEKFDEFCRVNRLGELATSSNTHPTTLLICNAFERFFRAECEKFEISLRKQTGRQIKLFCGFCSNDSLNAFAVQDQRNQYFIGINTGAFAYLSNACEQLFAQTSGLGEKFELGAVQNKFSRVQILTNIAFTAACHFVFAHELGHVAYGHADLLSTRRSHSHRPLSEANRTASPGSISSDLSQSMEVDADLYAATTVIGQLAHGALCGLNLTSFLQSPKDMLRVASFGVLMMFHLFYGRHVDISNYKLQTHPLPDIRLLKFGIRAIQMQTNLPQLKTSQDSLEQLFDDIATYVPPSLKDSLFPSFRLLGRASLQVEAGRIRANEDRFEKELNAFAMMPVGGVIL